MESSLPLTFHALLLPWLPLTVPSPSLGLLNHFIFFSLPLYTCYSWGWGGERVYLLSSLIASPEDQSCFASSPRPFLSSVPWTSNPMYNWMKRVIFAFSPTPCAKFCFSVRDPSSFYHQHHLALKPWSLLQLLPFSLLQLSANPIVLCLTKMVIS